MKKNKRREAIADAKTREERDSLILGGAEYFTAVKFLGAGKYERHEFKTLAEAEASAARMVSVNGGRYMLYVVSGNSDTYLKTIGK